MRAKLYTLGLLMEVLVSNKSYVSVEGENKETFLKRVQGLLEVDFDEAIEIVEISNKTLEKFSDDMVIEAYKASRGLQEEILKGILTKRNIEVEKIVKVAKAKIEKRDLAEMKSSPEYIEAKSNVGKLAEFKPLKSETVARGLVKSISLNKTNTIIYYNVLIGSNLKCCTSKNESLKFFEF